ncbi:hypothetical protein HWI79_2717 [Cryptosporidium felis]|nr:hypothetical protein HWI79_2717 [Cryptosporidium felis]
MKGPGTRDFWKPGKSEPLEMQKAGTLAKEVRVGYLGRWRNRGFPEMEGPEILGKYETLEHTGSNGARVPKEHEEEVSSHFFGP